MLRTGESALGVELCGSTSKKPQKVQQHHLVRTTFSTLTLCDHCGRILWGLVKQGFTCQSCGYVCHPDCSKDVKELKCTPKILDEKSLEILLSSTKKKQGVKSNLSQGSLLGLEEEHSEAISDLINGENQSFPIARAVTEKWDHVEYFACIADSNESIPQRRTN
ncbi:Myotubularin- protein 5 [Entomophthora muscae]|uniref:Myotubularin- protein 5 n=1 Tax=Entomophthora muscae TaxID=34485 RepID=A0ACC2T5H8_9FUNG|nr:Myotubularin- protein 5 [Entomophthora muscae]